MKFAAVPKPSQTAMATKPLNEERRAQGSLKDRFN